MSGWICLHREITDHWIWTDSEKLKAWVDMILLANHEDKKFLIKGQLLECKRGQLAYSQESLGERWKWTRGKVRNFLNILEKDSMITHKSNHLTTIITICNYNKFQDKQPDEQPAESQLTDISTPAESQLTDTNNNVNNYNNYNNENNKYIYTEKSSRKEKKQTEIDLLHSAGIDGEIAIDFITHRKAKSAPITKTVIDGYAREAKKANISLIDAVRISIERGWRGFKADWLKEEAPEPKKPHRVIWQ